ncbi:MAG: hypothetical protein GX620_15710 [Chloroflexi bacterium]|nr:hypothetical protein [Chloroflexota bacterium]
MSRMGQSWRRETMGAGQRQYNSPYEGEYLNRVAFPLGGIGGGTVCLEGTGALSHVSLRGKPDVFNEPLVFSALCVNGESNVARVLEGPVPSWKIFGPAGTGNGAGDKSYGLPRCSDAVFETRFPFARVNLRDAKLGLDVELTGWSPFVPGNTDDSSLPVAALEYRFHNPTDRPIEAVYSFHARNFMSGSSLSAIGVSGAEGTVAGIPGGFVLVQDGSAERPYDQGAFAAAVDDPEVKVNCAWFRGGWYDPLTMVWKTISEGRAVEAGPLTEGDPSPGGSLYVPFGLGPGEEKVIRVQLCWYVPDTGIYVGERRFTNATSGQTCCCRDGCEQGTHRPWYAGAFGDIGAVAAYWREEYERLRAESEAFASCFYDTTLPDEVVEAVAANLTILKSPTVLRQADGRFWGWEGCCDTAGCCAGTCTHVWNYAQALPHLFPELERSLRQTEFYDNQDERGHQAFRATLPIGPNQHDFHAAADGQLGGIMKVYRDWRISGDSEWLRGLWPRVKQSLDYCIETWDPRHVGALEEPHHNTYDIEFWGPDGMCTSFYVGALKAAMLMGQAVGDEEPLYEELYEKGKALMETELWDGEYFIQRIQWQGLNAGDPTREATSMVDYSPEARELLEAEGPKYQYGTGCLSDGVLGAWMAEVCGVGEVLDGQKVRSHLVAVHKYNLRHDLREHVNPQRPAFAVGEDGGLLLCSWPKGGALSLPFPYSDEVWTGIEYQVASHLMLMGRVEEGLEIVRVLRDRYDGRVRNPFNEYECGHWYARAMASYGMLQGLTGVRYDAVERRLSIQPRISGDFRAFLCTATGYGTVGVRNGEPFVDVVRGEIAVDTLVYEASA